MDAHAQVARAYLANHPEDAARELERAHPSEAAHVLTALTPAVAADVLRAIAPSAAAACADALADGPLAAIIAWLPADAGSAVLRRLDEARRQAVLALVDESVRSRLSGKLSYEENTAGSLADPIVPALAEDVTVADALLHMRRSRSHVLHYLYVVTRDGVLTGALTLPELMSARSRETIGSLMQRDVVRLEAHEELTGVAAHPAWSDYDALPVVDASRRLIGAIRHRSIRRMSTSAHRPLLSTLVGLSEVYWVGLSGILASFSPTRPVVQESADAH
jgi:magnesium transporter